MGKVLNYVLNLNLPKVKSLVLEVGCGRSEGKRYKKWIGLDLERTVKPTVVGDVHYLSFRANAFALVYSHGLVEHLENADLALSQMLMVGKCVFFSIPSRGGLINRLHNLFNLMKWRWIFPPERYYPDDYFHFKRRKIFRAVNIYEIRRNCARIKVVI